MAARRRVCLLGRRGRRRPPQQKRRTLGRKQHQLHWRDTLKGLITVNPRAILVAKQIEARFPNLSLWVPGKDTGIDLLVADARCQRITTLIVRYSRDYKITHMKELYQSRLRACAWFTLSRHRLLESAAALLVLVLRGLDQRIIDYVLIPPSILLERLVAIHGPKTTFHTYLWTTPDRRCWEARGLLKAECEAVAFGEFRSEARDFCPYLDNWNSLIELQTGGV